MGQKMMTHKAERDMIEEKSRGSHDAGSSLLLWISMSVSQVAILAAMAFVPASNKTVAKMKRWTFRSTGPVYTNSRA